MRIRTDTFSAINRIKSTQRYAITEYFHKLKFPEVQPTLITDNECESGACPFTVTTVLEDGKINSIIVKDDKSNVDFSKDFFRKRVYLTVSSQLHLETLVCGGLSKAWCMTTAFRAEPSTGPRHLAEFWMAEWEFCFGSLEDNIKITEGLIKYCLNLVLKEHEAELGFFQYKYKPGLIDNLKRYATEPFVTTTHAECIKIMLKDEEAGKIKFEVKPDLQEDLTKEHERYITDVLFGGKFVFVCHFPKKIKSFYMPIVDPGSEIEHVDGFDLLAPDNIGEIVGGSCREWDYDKLLMRMKEMGVKPESLEFYCELRKYGTVQHSGAGLGIDRLLMLMTGIHNIKDMVPYPRSYEKCLY